MKRFAQAIGLFLFALLVIAILLPTTGSSRLPQAYYYTPTPGADGRIIYTVKENDTCISIALLNDIDEQVLRSLNNLQGDDCQFLQVGQQLLIGVIEEATATPQTQDTPQPTPTPFKGNGTICIFLFNDANGNAMAEEAELPIAGGEVSLTDQLNNINLIGTTADTIEPLCFEDIPEGEYNISVAIPEGYNPTTVMNYALALSAGEVSIVDFGAQPSSSMQPIFGDDRPSPLLAVLGFFFIASGVGLFLYVRRMVS